MKISIESMTGDYLDSVMPGDEQIAKFRADCKEGLRRAGDFWKNESVKNAPRSPSASMLRKLTKAGGSYVTPARGRMAPKPVSLTAFYRQAASTLSQKKKGTFSGPAGGLRERLSGSNWKNPGGLERSIQFESDEEKMEVFVASNAEAGEYASIIHDMKGVKWKERGPGTQAKGDRADDKFVERARPSALERLQGVLAKALSALFGG